MSTTGIKAADRLVLSLLGEGPGDYYARYLRLRQLARSVRVSEYLVTNACNIRCKGCWFFEYDYDQKTKENKDIAVLRNFLLQERQRGINTALVIGGEPALVPDRVAVFREVMDHVSISTNGLHALPRTGLEDVAVLISVFGGGKLDDELRGIKPGGRIFSGLFDTALKNYQGDPRAFFIYAITEDGIPYIDDTVKKIRDNGNRVNFNFYSKYGQKDPLRLTQQQRLLDEALRVKDRYPDTLLSHPYYINTLITGNSHWGSFGYEVCPSISAAHPAHTQRLSNGNPVLPGFNAWAADLQTVNFCCTSGHCEDCRDSQAIFSWLLSSLGKFRHSQSELMAWIELAESYWAQFCWAKPPQLETVQAQPPGHSVQAPPRWAHIEIVPA